MESQEERLSIVLHSDLGNILKVLVIDNAVDILFCEGKSQPETEEKEIISQIRWIWYFAEVDK